MGVDPVQNLIRYRPSGTFFARFKVGGKLIRRSRDMTVFTVAELRLPDEMKKCRAGHEARRALGNGKLTFGDAVRVYREKIEGSRNLKPKSKTYYAPASRLLEAMASKARGDELFVGKAQCSTRHVPPVYMDNQYGDLHLERFLADSRMAP